MKIIQRLKVGLVLTKDALLVMRHNPKLFAFPIVSGVTGLTFLATFLGVTFGLMAITPEGGVLVGLALVYLSLTFVSTFFTAALVHQTRAVLAGEDASLRAGMSAAWARKTPILIWSIISAIVGVILNSLSNSDSSGASRGIAAGLSIAWTALTFFVVPVIVFEREGVVGMFTRSASEFKNAWGETTISLGAVQVISFAVTIPFFLGAYALAGTSVVAAAGVLLAGISLAFVLTQTLQGVIRTTLYLYATEGVAPEEFDDVDFEGLAEERIQKRATASPGGFVGK
ncbi:DUF6159 family protein [Halovivax sp.]|uniref:DUF6159 family protein n=1 Tax=Halovivax sp. TaxID=1935978 RepID=UPI0025C1D8F0|nr:DUF6159 family protein [Halovivax sp.]